MEWLWFLKTGCLGLPLVFRDRCWQWRAVENKCHHCERRGLCCRHWLGYDGCHCGCGCDTLFPQGWETLLHIHRSNIGKNHVSWRSCDWMVTKSNDRNLQQRARERTEWLMKRENLNNCSGNLSREILSLESKQLIRVYDQSPSCKFKSWLKTKPYTLPTKTSMQSMFPAITAVNTNPHTRCFCLAYIGFLTAEHLNIRVLRRIQRALFLHLTLQSPSQTQ